MKIALTYNLKKQDSSKPEDYFSEFDSVETVNAIASAIRNKGHSVELVEAESLLLLKYFRKTNVDMVFNIAEGKRGKFRESEIPALLEYLKIPFTGSNTFSLALALNKAFTKKLLNAENIPTPAYQIFKTGKEELDASLRFPLIAKPNCEGSAKGIASKNVVNGKDELYRVIQELKNVYSQDILVEEFIDGKELTVGILENGKIKVLPILEIDFSSCIQSGEYFYSWRMKEFQGDKRLGLLPKFHCPARLDKETEERIKDVAIRTHRAVGCFDISRTDIRLDKNNIPYVLEINPLPGLDPNESNFPLMAYAAGMKYDDLIEAILLSAAERKNLN
ncbi:MAG: ATP-grasp domain-containing protein [Candidatus Omnitrophota bacterium]